MMNLPRQEAERRRNLKSLFAWIGVPALAAALTFGVAASRGEVLPKVSTKTDASAETLKELNRSYRELYRLAGEEGSPPEITAENAAAVLVDFQDFIIGVRMGNLPEKENIMRQGMKVAAGLEYLAETEAAAPELVLNQP